MLSNSQINQYKNDGDIVLQSSTGKQLSLINAGENVSHVAVYRVPDANELLLREIKKRQNFNILNELLTILFFWETIFAKNNFFSLRSLFFYFSNLLRRPFSIVQHVPV